MKSAMTNEELSLLARDGDGDAWAELLKKNKGICLKWAARFSSHAPFEDNLSFIHLCMAEFVKNKYPSASYPNSSWLTGFVWYLRSKVGRYVRETGYRQIRLPEHVYFVGDQLEKMPRVTLEFDDLPAPIMRRIERRLSRGDETARAGDKRLIRLFLEREIGRFIRGLEKGQRDTVLAVYWRDMNFTECRRAMGLSNEAHRLRHAKALEALREKVPPEWAALLIE